MSIKTRILFLTALFFVPILAESQYECGSHGRFEYCIDGIPGCVIGCHCHPGYYFDTDSKICEPNIKLTQDFRRQYLSEPTRVYVAPVTTTLEDQPITPNAVDEKIDEIAKDADDLGDWLYNQFFKTIENQVINKTQGEELPPTRRSGDILLNKPSRRSHWKSKRKKKKKKGLKSKLLRITEDDSLFDSDSGDSSHEEYSSSSSESETEAEDKSDKKENDHGHKKIIIFNKKPQPPLPSFIFMPNMDTPYYPPIGLPPPPAMPMYPMIPVPPVMPGPPVGGPLFPYPGVPYKCEDDATTTTESTSTAATTVLTTEQATSTATTEAQTASSTTTETPTTVSEATSEPTTEPTTEPSTSEPPPNLRQRHKKRKKLNGRINDEMGVPTNFLLNGNRNKQLMKRLREKLNRKRKLENFFVDQYQEFDAPLIGNNPSDFIPKRDLMTPDEMLQPQDVDFKYLAELIHKADLNKTLKGQSKPKANLPESEPILHPVRRSYEYYPMNNMNNNMKNNVKRQKSRMEDPNDLFYTNLGKQIASMIRKIDSNEQREVNIEIEGSKQQSQTSPVFNENNYASRSFWERSVRSPLKYINTFTREMDYLKKSNEDLFSLENKVEIAATTTPKLSLHDLENIISTVQKVKSTKPKRHNHYQETNDNSNALALKLNLLPENIETIQPVPKPKAVQSLLNKDSDTINKLNARKQQDGSNSFLLSNFRQLSPDYDESIRNSGTGKFLFPNSKPTRKPSTKKTPEESGPAQPLYQKPTFFKIPKNKANLKYQVIPVLLNHRKLNYHTNRNNPYLFENVAPIQYSSINKSLGPYGMIEKPSYFHHEFNHFDFFDK